MSDTVEENLPASPSQTRDAAELLLSQLDYWRGRAAARKMRSELLAIRLSIAERVCESVWNRDYQGNRDEYEQAFEDWVFLAHPEAR